MTRFAWPKLMRLGMVELGLAPAVFWDLTPVELMLLAGFDAGPATLDRAGLAALMARFPDAGRGAAPEGEG